MRVCEGPDAPAVASRILAQQGLSSVSKPVLRVAVALVHRGGSWLVARRHDDAHLGGLWEFPGGKRLTDESAESAALRELIEECGVDAQAERVLDSVIHEDEQRHVTITPVICQWQAGAARPIASLECRWVTLAEMRRLEMPPANGEIIRQLKQMT